jgi:DNA polymerase-3 subunit alpha
VFQVESPACATLVEMRPDRFEDIIALVALYRPGPMDNIPTYNAASTADEEPTTSTRRLRAGRWTETYGVIVYQEQVMQIAQELSGYSLGEADLLRRAMGKKIKAEMDAQRARFVKGAMRGRLSQDARRPDLRPRGQVRRLWLQQVARGDLCAGRLPDRLSQGEPPGRILRRLDDARHRQHRQALDFRREAIKVERPSLNRSGVDFDVADGAIRYALGAIKGVGRAAVESIVTARAKEGPFRDLADFARRIDTRLVNRRTIEALISAGTLDEIEPERAKAMAAVDGMLALSNRTRDEAAAGQLDMLGRGGWCRRNSVSRPSSPGPLPSG